VVVPLVNATNAAPVFRQINRTYTTVPSVATTTPSSAPRETLNPSQAPSRFPTLLPSSYPTSATALKLSADLNSTTMPLPTTTPTTRMPSQTPTLTPTLAPSRTPSVLPSKAPTYAPSSYPTYVPALQLDASPGLDFASPGFATLTISMAGSLSDCTSALLTSVIASLATAAGIAQSLITVTVQSPSEPRRLQPRGVVLRATMPSSGAASVVSQIQSGTLTHLGGVLVQGVAVSTGAALEPIEALTRWPALMTWRTVEPTVEPSFARSEVPSDWPTFAPSGTPSDWPTLAPTADPTPEPSPLATPWPSDEPTSRPSGWPTLAPSEPPSDWPTLVPTGYPTLGPTTPVTAAPQAGSGLCMEFLSEAELLQKHAASPSAVTANSILASVDWNEDQFAPNNLNILWDTGA
jgi:hypothetical protein